MRYDYDSRYVPPAPVVELMLGAPRESFSVGPLHALIDTGADATIVPIHVLSPIGAQIADRRWLRGAWGERRRVDIYFLDVGIGNLRLPFIDIVADDQGDEVIVGRNVLNKLRLTLDGPRLRLDVRG